LAISPYETSTDPYHEPEPMCYTSNALRLFVEGLGQLRGGQILDVGPACGDNINFLAPRVRRLFVCDMFIRLDREQRLGLPAQWVWRHLDYSPKNFDGILLWDLVDHLDNSEVERLRELTHRMLRKSGMAVVVALSQQSIQPVVNSFVIGDDYRLSLRPQRHLELPLHIRENREMLELFAPFIPVRSFIYRNGIREFLFRRN